MTADEYGFLASAVAGRRVSIHVSSRGDAAAYTDGWSIFLPSAAEPGPAAGQGTRGGAMPPRWLAVVAQAALIAAGSLDPAVLRQLIGRRELARRYLYLEVLRASRAVAARLPVRYEAQPELDGVSPPSGSTAESLKMAKSRRRLPAPPPYFGVLRPSITLRRAMQDGAPSAIARLAGTQRRQDVQEIDDEEASEKSAILWLLRNPLSAGNPLSTLWNDIIGAALSKAEEISAGEGGGEETPIGRIERTLQRGIRAVLAAAAAALPDFDVPAANQALRYPEWDVHRKAYRPEWVLVKEVDAWPPDGAQELRQVLEPPPREFKRQLASLGLDHEMHRTQHDGADLDLGALLECAIEIRTGQAAPSANVYRASRRTRRDLAAVIVLDISGSTGEAALEGDSVFVKQVKLAYQLGLSFNACGDALALFGFHSWGRKLVRVVRLKGHQERWSDLIAQRLTWLKPVGYTRTGAAIRHGSRLLSEGMRLPNRLLVVITDGIAYDQDYEHGYGECDTRKALEEARSEGIGCVALCVGSDAESGKLSEVFGAANILAVDEVAQVSGRIRDVCRRALAVSRRKVLRSAAG